LFDKETKKINKSKIYIFQTPIWDSVVSAGDLLIMQNKNNKYYNQILEVYDRFKAIELMQSVNNDEFKEYINNEVEEIVKLIPDIINK